MEAITMDKNDLIKKLKENRKAHRKIFEEALDGYRMVAIAELEKMLTDARAGRKIARSLDLIEPMDQTKDYDRVILMLELTQDIFIKLSERDFATYVLDDWSWKDQFLASNSAYMDR